MTASERRKLMLTLESLHDRGDLPLDVWSQLVEAVIRKACPPESKIHATLSELEGDWPSEGPPVDELTRRYQELLKTAQNILEVTPLVSPDEALEREVLGILKEKFFTSWPFKMLGVFASILILLYLGGTVFFGSEIIGFSKTKDEAVKRVEQIVKLVYTEANKETQRELQTQKEDAIKSIKAALGDKKKKTGALGAIRTETEGAITTITNVLGPKNEKGTVLWRIQDKKRIALETIDGLIAQKDLEGKVNRLADRVAELSTKINSFPASQIEKAHKILSEKFDGVQPATVVSLLNVSSWTLALISILSFGSFGIACIALWKAWKPRPQDQGNGNLPPEPAGAGAEGLGDQRGGAGGG